MILGKGTIVQNLISRLENLIWNRRASEDVLSRKTLFYLIEAMETKMWHSAGRAIERLIFEREMVFTQSHVQALQRLHQTTAHEEIREATRGLLDVLRRRRRDLF